MSLNLVIFFCCFFQTLSFSQKPLTQSDKNSVLSNFSDTHQSLSQNDIETYCDDSEKHVSSNIISFHFLSNTVVSKITCFGDCLLLSSSLIESDNFYLTLDVPKGESKTSFEFKYITNEVTWHTLYFCENDGVFYSSALSIDDAKIAAGLDVGYDLISTEEEPPSEEEMQRINSSFSKTSGSVSGYLMWTDDEGEIRPLVHCLVRVYVQGNIFWYKSCYTNDEGYYYLDYFDIPYIGTGRAFISIEPSNGNVDVGNNLMLRYCKRQIFNRVGGDHTYSYIFSPINDGNIGKAMILFQIAHYYSEFGKMLNNNQPLKICSFLYPCVLFPGTDCTNFGPLGGVIRIVSYENPSSSDYPNSYASWDVIGHEYGHHIQHFFGLIDSPGGQHAIYESTIDRQFKITNNASSAKDRGLRLAWGEGLPTFLSVIAQKTFPSDFQGLYSVGDSIYTDYERFWYEIDTYFPKYSGGTKSAYLGEGDEIAVTSILYKMYSAKTDSIDELALDFELMWDAMKKSKPKTLFAFINALYEKGVDPEKIAKLLGEFNVIFDDVQIEDNYLDKAPTFKWSAYYGTNLTFYNEFSLIFSNSRNEEIFTIDSFTAESIDINYTLPFNKWAKILSNSDDTFNLVIKAFDTNGKRTGGYISKRFSFSKPTEYINAKQIKPNEWGFAQRYYFENEGIKESTFTKGSQIINTSRLRCGYIENSFIVLSPRRQGAGRAYFEMNFNEPIYSFIYRLCLWSDKEYLDGTAFMQVKDEYGNWSNHIDLPITNLPTKNQSIKGYAYINTPSISFPFSLDTEFKPIYGIRFETTSSAVGNNNKGRLCIDDIVLFDNPPDSLDIIEAVFSGSFNLLGVNWCPNYGKTNP